MRVATYGLSFHRQLEHYAPAAASLELLVGVSGIDPACIIDLHGVSPEDRWQKLLARLEVDGRDRLLLILRRLASWQRAGAQVRIVPPAPLGGLMHLKLYLGDEAALVGSANFTMSGVEGADQHELLIEVSGPPLLQLSDWWEMTWKTAWPVGTSYALPKTGTGTQAAGSTDCGTAIEENQMNNGARNLLGHWLGKWGAWALNGNGVVAYPHQLQAVEWIRPGGKAYLLGDEVGLGKTFTAALLWLRHRQLYGEKARLMYVTKPSLIIDAISAFVSVLGLDEFLQTDVPVPQKAGDIHPRFSIFHAGTACWEMVADEDGRKRNKDHQVAGLLKEGRYRVRPDAFQNKIAWLSAFAAKKLHEQISISAVKRLLEEVYTFVSIDTLRNPDHPLTHVFDKLNDLAQVV